MNITPNAGAGAESHVETAGQAENQTQTANTEQAAEGQGAEQEQKAYTAEDFKQLQKQLQKEQRRINRLTAAKYAEKSQNKVLAERLAKFEQAQAEKADARPNAEQFQTYDEYNEAVARWAARQEGKPKAGEQPKAETQPNIPPQEAAWRGEKQAHTISQAQQLAQHIPDFADTWNENGELLDALPYEIEKALYQSQHPALAIYVLAKEGKLEELLDMAPQQAAYEIGRATFAGVNNIQSWTKKPQAQAATKAPQPLQNPNKGAGPGSKSEDAMSGKELRKKHGVL